MGELLAEDGAAMLPLPSTRFDAVRWERRRADREGRVEVDGTLYCAGPYWHGRWMLVGLRDRTVEIRDERGRHAATLPRSWGARETVFDPATLIPAVTARPRSWEQSQLRACVGQPLREGLDRCGADERRLVLRALRSASGRRSSRRAGSPTRRRSTSPAGRCARWDARGRPSTSASTTPSRRGVAALASADEIVEAGRRCSLTKAVLRRWAESGTPRQRDYLLGYLLAEGESRDASKRAQLLRRCALPQAKTLEGYDWSCVSWPEGLGRGDLESLSFVEAREDLVLMGDVGTGKTHMACALAAACCARGWEARFFTASSLVLRLRRARDDGRLDRELSQIGRARLLVVDELGFLPLDADGARLLFQVVSEAYERQSVVFTTNLEFSMWGQTFGDEQMAAAVIDRVVHHGRLLRFRGESYRVRNALMGGKGVAQES